MAKTLKKTADILSSVVPGLRGFFHRVLQATTPQSRTFPVSVGQDVFIQNFANELARLPIEQKQRIMLRGYRSNLYIRRFVDSLIAPIVGPKGCSIQVSKDDHADTQNVIRRFVKFNELDEIDVQMALVRDLLVIGEVFILSIPNDHRLTFQLCQIPAFAIRQTIVDPQNVNRVIGVEQTMDGAVNQRIVHRVINADEERFSDQAQSFRRGLPFECFAFQNMAQSDPIPARTEEARFDPLRKYERRGEPFLITAADLLEKLLAYMWNSIDKADSWNNFVYVFDVDTSRATSDQQVKEMLRKWRQEYGVPRHNTSLFLPSGIQMRPQSFPMQGGDLSIVQRMIQTSAAWTAYMRSTEMDESQTRYATNTGEMVSEPTIEKKKELQRTQLVKPLSTMLDTVCTFAYLNHEIAVDELKEPSFPYEFHYTLNANEVSPRNASSSSTAFDTIAKSLLTIAAEGDLVDRESVGKALIKKADELLGIELTQADTQTIIAGANPANVIRLSDRRGGDQRSTTDEDAAQMTEPLMKKEKTA